MLMKLLKSKRLEGLRNNLYSYKQNNKENFIDDKIITLKNNTEIGIVNSNIMMYEDEKINFCRLYVFSYKTKIGYLNYKIDSGKNPNEIFIDDIKINIQNKGIGTQAIKYLEKIAIDNDIKIIRGELSPIDLNDYEEMLIHFYKKQGFNIQDNKIMKFIK